MIDIFAVFSIVGAAAKTENSSQLFADAEELYGAYSKMKAGQLNFEQLAEAGQLKPLIQAAYRVALVADKLIEDPTQAKNIASLLSSI